MRQAIDFSLGAANNGEKLVYVKSRALAHPRHIKHVLVHQLTLSLKKSVSDEKVFLSSLGAANNWEKFVYVKSRALAYS